MSSDQAAIEIVDLSKCYKVYDKPADRLKQFLFPWKKRYADQWALKDFNLSIRKGESVGIIGRNGSGKSTLLQCLAGTLTPTTGSVEVVGKVAALLELGAGFNPDFSGRDNVYLSGSILGLTHAQVNEKFDQIAEFSGVEDFLDQPVKTYSSGMFMRLAFSIVAHVDADILIIDEALAVGDAFFVQKCMRFLRKFQETGTVLFVSHDIGSVMNLCDRAAWLRDGELVNLGEPKVVCEDYLADKYSEEMGITRRTQAPKPRAPVNRPAIAKDATTAPLTTGSQVLSGIWFDPNATGFGTGLVTVDKVDLLSRNGEVLELLQGGEEVVVRVTAECHVELENLIVGFSVKDRLGQHLLGENTSLMDNPSHLVFQPGESVIAEFTFSMPLLLTGEYSICAAVASGSMEEHVQHQWVHDALLFTVQSSSLAGVHVGLPMTSIGLEKLQPTVEPTAS